MSRKLVSPGAPPCRQFYNNTCRTLHLAFKQMDVEEIYSVLSNFLMRTIRNCDLLYHPPERLEVEKLPRQILGRCHARQPSTGHHPKARRR